MKDRASPDPSPEEGGPHRPEYGPHKIQRSQKVPRLIVLVNKLSPDRWIALYILFLEGHTLGPVGRHYVDAAHKALMLLGETGDTWFRWQAWRAVHAACTWLAQLEGDQS